MEISRHQAVTRRLCSWICCIAMLAVMPIPAFAIVRSTGHIDFVLSTGTTVRLFPEAALSGRLSTRPITRTDPEVETKPPGGDPCVKMKEEYDKRSSDRESAGQGIQLFAPPAPPVDLVQIAEIAEVALPLSALDDGTLPKGWYYLPMEPRIATKGGIPEATFVKFVTDEETADGGAEGGIFHIMATFGLTKAEETELRELLSKAVPGGKLKGMVDLQPAKNGDNFVVTSGTLSDTGFAPTGVLTSGRAPSMPGSKAAIAGRLSATGAQLLEATFENPTADMSVTFAYDYVAKLPAFTGQLRVNLDRIKEIADCTLTAQDKTEIDTTTYNWVTGTIGAAFLGPVGFLAGIGSDTETRISKQNLNEAYETLTLLGAIEIIFDQNLPDADVSELEAQLMETAMSSFMNLQESFMTEDEFGQREEPGGGDGKDEGNQDPDADTWEVFELTRKYEKRSGTIQIQLTKNMAVYRTHQITGNLGGLLRPHRDEVFTEVLLNDPFFKRGKITVNLDSSALELYAQGMVNHASVKVEVPFKGEANYQNDDIFTTKDIEAGRILSDFSFSTRGVDINRKCPFTYLTSWSMKGGGAWPKNPKPTCSKSMGVTLVPPIELRRIDVEADLDEFERSGVRAADVVFRYTLYGQRKTDTARFRVARPEPYVEHVLYVDKNASNVEYQVILTHREHGKLPVAPWTTLEGDFVFASLTGLPVDILDQVTSIIPEIAEALGL